MRLQDYKLIFITLALIGILLITSPILGAILRLTSREQFNELYILGPKHTAEGYPSNVAIGQNYSIYIGVGDHLGSSAYYVLYVKFGNRTDLLPNSTRGTPSPLQPLYEYRFLIQDSKVLESPLTFTVVTSSFLSNNSQIKVLKINSVAFNVNKQAKKDVIDNSFRYILFFELWTYNRQSGSIQYNNRFVTLQLNLTQPL